MRRSTALLISVITLLVGVIAGILFSPARNGFGSFLGFGASYRFEGAAPEKKAQKP